MSAVLVSPTPFTGLIIAQDVYRQSAMQRIGNSADRLAKDLNNLDLSNPKICNEVLAILAPVSQLITKATLARRHTPEYVVLVVTSAFGTTPEGIKKRCINRNRTLADVRHACFYYLFYYTSLSLKEIGEFMQGDRKKAFDHTTVMHGRDKVQDLFDTGEWQNIAKLIQDNLIK